MTNADNAQDKDAVQFPTADNNPDNDGTANSSQNIGATTGNNAPLDDKNIGQQAAPEPTQESTSESDDMPAEDTLDDAIEESFPASDPVSVTTKKPEDTQS